MHQTPTLDSNPRSVLEWHIIIIIVVVVVVVSANGIPSVFG